MNRLLLLLLVGLSATTARADALLFGANGNGSPLTPGGLVVIDQTTGAGALVADTVSPGGLTGIDFSPGGALFGTTNAASFGSTSSLVTIDPATGALLSTIGPIGLSIGDLAYDPVNDLLYGIRSNADGDGLGGELYTINTTTGLATFVGDTGAGAGGGIAFSPSGQLFQTSYNSSFDFLSLNEIDPFDASRISTVALSHFFDGLAIRPTDGTLFATPGGSDEIYTISLTGVETLVGATGTGRTSDLAFQAAPVPEPGTLVLLGIGLAGLVWTRRQRQVATLLGTFDAGDQVIDVAVPLDQD